LVVSLYDYSPFLYAHTTTAHTSLLLHVYTHSLTWVSEPAGDVERKSETRQSRLQIKHVTQKHISFNVTAHIMLMHHLVTTLLIKPPTIWKNGCQNTLKTCLLSLSFSTTSRHQNPSSYPCEPEEALLSKISFHLDYWAAVSPQQVFIYFCTVCAFDMKLSNWI
jgi:hypothetical protein